MLKPLAAAGGLLFLLAAAALGDDTADRDKLIGKWTQGSADADETWSLETVGDSLRVTHILKQKSDEFECNIMGHDCDVKLAGKRAKVSLWFNGGMLVELETRGNEVLKRRFKAGEGDTLQIEVIPINPGGKPEMEHFKRVQVSAERK
ncbi:MAG TPA: hypothetical protein VMS37_13355 [Verrucomicrobiae bacterium]|nr:hypothetical protein [Verrucomicrobiae bacterium]